MNVLLVTIIFLLVISAVVGHPVLGTIFVVLALGVFLGITYKDMNSSEGVRLHSETEEQETTENDQKHNVRIDPCPQGSYTCYPLKTVGYGGPKYSDFYEYLNHDDPGRPDKYSIRTDIPEGEVDPRYSRYASKLDKVMNLY